jgi:hypothetical protein
MNHHPADDLTRRIETLIRWTCREQIRFRWYLLRLTVREMNHAARRMTELQAGIAPGRASAPRARDDQEAP